MADDLASLRAHLDEDERVARACIAEVGGGHAGEPYEDGSGICDRDDYPSYPWGVGEAELAFMARFGPRWVLGLVAAAGEVVAHAESMSAFAEEGPDSAVLRGACNAYDVVVRALASVYGDEPTP